MLQKKIIIGLVIVILAIAVLLLNKRITGEYIEMGKTPLTNITFLMDWIPGSDHIPYWVAMDKGFYQKEGIEVELIPGKGSSLSVTLVGSGKINFAVASADVVLASKAKDVPVVVLATLFQDSETGLISLKEKNITQLTDLYGKKLGTDIKGVGHEEYIAFLKANNLDRNKITEVPVSDRHRSLLSGEVDVIDGFIPSAVPILESKGASLNVIALKDYGIHTYGISIITNENLIKENPELVRRFMNATIEGWKFYIEHPNESIDIFLKYYPESDRVVLQKSFQYQLQFIQSNITQKYGLGFQTMEGWTRTQDTYFELNMTDREINLSAVFTNDFLPT